MKCAVAIVLALIGVAVGNPLGTFPVGAPPKGLGLASPLLVPSPAGVGYSVDINHGYTVNILPALKILSPPLSFALPALGYKKWQY